MISSSSVRFKLLLLVFGSFALCTIIFIGCGGGSGNSIPPPTSRASMDPLPAKSNAQLAQYNLRGRWQKQNLTYYIKKFSTDLDQNSQRQIIAQAFNTWAAVIPLTFQETQTESGSDFVIGFGSRGHCELYSQCPTETAFDGPSGILAHCYFPPGSGGPNAGKAHFDEDEQWAGSTPVSNQISLLSVAIHELGHGLGLDHSEDQNAVMYASYNPGNIKTRLATDDITGIQKLYGAKDGSQPPATPQPPPSNPPTVPSPGNPNQEDTDGDGVPNSVEIYNLGTNPNDPDTDKDGLPDIEAYYGLNPLNPDTDGDGRSDGQEVREGTNPFVPDSNGNVSFAGDYNGTDTVGSSISIRIYGNGRVEGVYYTLLYGYPYNIYLSGAVSPQGRIQMLTSDYLFAFDGQVGANGTASGVVAYYYGGQANWVLQRTGRSMTPAVVKRAKVTDFLKLSRRTRDATNDFISRVFYRVQWH